MAITVYGDSISGNCWKVATILRLTGRAFGWVETDVRAAADIALVAYTQAADEGGFELGRWPHVQAWVARMLALPGLVPLPRPPAA